MDIICHVIECCPGWYDIHVCVRVCQEGRVSLGCGADRVSSSPVADQIIPLYSVDQLLIYDRMAGWLAGWLAGCCGGEFRAFDAVRQPSLHAALSLCGWVRSDPLHAGRF